MTTCMSAPAAAQCRTCQTSRGSSQLTSPPPLITTSIHTIEDDDALSVLLLGQGLGCAVPFFMHLFCTWYEQWPASLLLSSPIHFLRSVPFYAVLLLVCRRGLLYRTFPHCTGPEADWSKRTNHFAVANSQGTQSCHALLRHVAWVRAVSFNNLLFFLIESLVFLRVGTFSSLYDDARTLISHDHMNRVHLESCKNMYFEGLHSNTGVFGYTIQHATRFRICRQGAKVW